MRTRKLYIYECLVEYLIAILSSGVFLVALLKQVGMSDALTGILSSLISLGCISQLFSSLIVKKGRSIRKTILVITLCCDVLFALVHFLPFLPFKGVMVGICCAVMRLTSYILMYICSPTKYRYFMRFVDIHKRGSFTATKEIISLFGGMTFSLVMGWLFDRCNEAQDGSGSLLCGCVILLLTIIQLALLYFSEEAPEDMQNEVHKPPLQECLSLFRVSSPLRKLLVMDILWNFAVYISTPYFAAYLIGDLGFSVTQVTLFSVVYSIARAAFSKPLCRYGDRNGFLGQISLGLMLVAASFFINCFTMPQTRMLYLVYYVLYAVAFAALNSGMVNVSFDYIPERDYATAAGIRKAVGGVTGFLTSLLGGKILSAMQEGGIRIALFPYPQQLLSCVSFGMCLVIMLYAKMFLSKLKRVEE